MHDAGTDAGSIFRCFCVRLFSIPQTTSNRNKSIGALGRDVWVVRTDATTQLMRIEPQWKANERPPSSLTMSHGSGWRMVGPRLNLCRSVYGSTTLLACAQSSGPADQQRRKVVVYRWSREAVKHKKHESSQNHFHKQTRNGGTWYVSPSSVAPQGCLQTVVPVAGTHVYTFTTWGCTRCSVF